MENDFVIRPHTRCTRVANPPTSGTPRAPCNLSSSPFKGLQSLLNYHKTENIDQFPGNLDVAPQGPDSMLLQSRSPFFVRRTRLMLFSTRSPETRLIGSFGIIIKAGTRAAFMESSNLSSVQSECSHTEDTSFSPEPAPDTSSQLSRARACIGRHIGRLVPYHLHATVSVIHLPNQRGKFHVEVVAVNSPTPFSFSFSFLPLRYVSPMLYLRRCLVWFSYHPIVGRTPPIRMPSSQISSSPSLLGWILYIRFVPLPKPVRCVSQHFVFIA